MSLQDLQGRWLEKWDEMREISRPHVTLAAPFTSVDVDRQLPQTIMLVGKATHGNWCMDSFEKARSKSELERVQERKDATINFLKDCAPTYPSAFWGFYRDLSKSIRANTIWTNIAKIGVCRPQGEKKSINPSGPFLKAQKELAIETLAAEVLEYAPDLVLFVTAGDDPLDGIVTLVCGSEREWEKKSLLAGNPVWIRRRSTNHPPVLCTGHPGYKSGAVRKAWIMETSELMS
jgi:hypothetical protein